MLKLHAFFDAKAVFDAKAPGGLATIGAEDVRKALHELGLRASQPSTPGRGVSFGAASSTEVAPRLSAASSGFSPITSSPPPSSLPSKPPSVLPSAEPSALPSPIMTPLPLSVLQGVAALEPALDGSRPPPPATPIDIVASEAGVRQQASWPSASSWTEHEDNTPLRSPADSSPPQQPPVQIAMAAASRRFSFAQFVREIQARMREHLGREVPLFEPPLLHGTLRQERESVRDGRGRDSKPATPRGRGRKEALLGRGLSFYVTASQMEPDALEKVSSSVVALVGKDNALRALSAKKLITEQGRGQGRVEDFGVARVVRGETPSQSSPETRPLESVSPPQSSPVESVSSREMGKLLRTRSMHVELQSDALALDWESQKSQSPLAKHALSTSDLPSMARAPSPPLPPPMSPLPPEPAPSRTRRKRSAGAQQATPDLIPTD